MNCYDCVLAGRTTPAIGTCNNCGAGVCLQDAQLTVHELPHAASPGNYTHLATRSLFCPSCFLGTHIPAPTAKAHTTAGR